ncbi:hypothetical protein CHS0354_036905 [Potamilus streckersoni]|uniref:Uncharacterized protein n=1 Tax=Potamilus streckersoni TaxID=2493646 RepID=A0AAE0S6R0_9BIVA|nr:hypothetical protein CHS0354_036905 [Potamilus streckersoni]
MKNPVRRSSYRHFVWSIDFKRRKLRVHAIEPIRDDHSPFSCGQRSPHWQHRSVEHMQGFYSGGYAGIVHHDVCTDVQRKLCRDCKLYVCRNCNEGRIQELCNDYTAGYTQWLRTFAGILKRDMYTDCTAGSMKGFAKYKYTSAVNSCTYLAQVLLSTEACTEILECDVCKDCTAGKYVGIVHREVSWGLYSCT